ncbi:hypothetical protein LX36DRAFT_97153 [Colletotrichum falcatum]|nr:hypothetical protein LX36DRAFT_97153 [Colletotrichum falcatum]
MSEELPRHERRPSSPTQHGGSYRGPLDPCDMSIKTLLGFISTRALRGGPRLVIQLILAAFGLLLVGKFLTSPASTDTLLGSGSRWSWSPFGKSEGQGGAGVRLVVFGTPDIATPSTTGKSAKGKGEKDKGWTEMLCEELRCSSHQSFVPSTSLPAQAMTATEQYRDTLERLASEPQRSQPPGYNYAFMLEQFPLSDAIANLTSQVDAFLAQPRPRPRDVPRETVWVFSFGTWDVWMLASLPRDVGRGIVDAAVEALFAQVERVYQASLDAGSVAFSDFWAREDDAGGGGEEGVDPREVENFRVVVPALFDISLTPGWHAQRPAPPRPHSKAEQMTNAAYLTARWNAEVKDCMDEWMRTPDPRPEDDGDEDGGFGYVADDKGRGSSAAAKRVRRALRDYDDDDDEGSAAALLVPFPRRVGAQVDAASFVREAIVERQMRDHGLTDATGRGNRTTEGGGGEQGNGVFFAETWVPCIWAKTSEVAEAAGGYAACDAPGDYLFQSPFTLSEPAIRETARIAAAEARRTLAFVDRAGRQGEEGRGRKQAGEMDPSAKPKSKPKSKKRETRGEASGSRRAVRLVEAACPTLDVC